MNLADVNPAARIIEETAFPRSEKILYRGTHEDQYSFKRAVRAMLDDTSVPLESPMLAAVKLELMGKPNGLFRKISGLVEEYTSQKIQHLVAAKIKANGGAFSEAESLAVAIEIMNAAYDNQFARTRIYDYVSAYRDDFPKAFVYSTVYLEVAKVYSSHIVIFKERVPRSLDANYWNKIQNGKWVHTNLTYPDRGEFITPFYIPAKDILGYQYARSGYTALWNVWRNLSPDLGYVFMKKVVGKTPYVMIFDGTGLQHIMESNGVFCSAVTQFNPYEELPKFPRIDCSRKPKLVSIAMKCPAKSVDSKSCKVPDSLFAPYEMSTTLDSESIQMNKNISLSNEEVIVNFPAGESRKRSP